MVNTNGLICYKGSCQVQVETYLLWAIRTPKTLSVFSFNHWCWSDDPALITLHAGCLVLVLPDFSNRVVWLCGNWVTRFNGNRIVRCLGNQNLSHIYDELQWLPKHTLLPRTWQLYCFSVVKHLAIPVPSNQDAVISTYDHHPATVLKRETGCFRNVHNGYVSTWTSQENLQYSWFHIMIMLESWPCN